jgi:hypothetical protein
MIDSASLALLTVYSFSLILKSDMLLTVQVSWDVMLCHWVNGLHRSRGSWCLHLQG